MLQLQKERVMRVLLNKCLDSTRKISSWVLYKIMSELITLSAIGIKYFFKLTVEEHFVRHVQNWLSFAFAR